MESSEILDYLATNGAVLTNSHFIYTNGGHGTAYINMRQVAHHAAWIGLVAQALGHRLHSYQPDVFVGPETLGRSLAEKAATWVAPEAGVWCDIDDVDGVKTASFKEKLDFGRIISGKRVVIVDDLLTTGSSIEAVSRLVAEAGGEVVAAGVVVRRSPDVTAANCGAPALEVLAEVDGFALFTPEECLERGPCSQQVPVQLRPGHGWRWAELNPDYPTV